VAVDADVVTRLHERAKAARWGVDETAFGRALEASARRMFEGDLPSARDLERGLRSLHLEDLALARACADGHEAAWEHLMTTCRPALYRAADSLDPAGGAREVADSLWAELYGVRGRAPGRSLLESFHGRSSLLTWLRSVLAQRHVDRFRERRRNRPLPEENTPGTLPAPDRQVEPERARWIALMRDALGHAVAALSPRDRMRLGCYYAQGLTLAEVGRISGEHEATVSRNLARTRAAIRTAVERYLADEGGLDGAEIDACFASVSADTGPLDLGEVVDGHAERKKPRSDRSQEEQVR